MLIQYCTESSTGGSAINVFFLHKIGDQMICIKLSIIRHVLINHIIDIHTHHISYRFICTLLVGCCGFENMGRMKQAPLAEEKQHTHETPNRIANNIGAQEKSLEIKMGKMCIGCRKCANTYGRAIQPILALYLCCTLLFIFGYIVIIFFSVVIGGT